MTLPVVVVGGGAAGLATAAGLLRRGVRPVVLDQGDRVGQSWAERYDRLHLHTPRIQSHLPGLRIPASAGRWVARDDFVAYLRRYAARHRVDVRFGVQVDAVRPDGEGYRVTGRDRAGGEAVDLVARHVVVATGINRLPVVPDWSGAAWYPGELLHASAYRSAAGYRGRDVLVVGAGNSGAEIAADLAESGAGRVWLAIRTPPHVIPRQAGPVPTTLLGIPQSLLPARLVDPGTALLARAVLGDLAPLGLPAPDEGVAARMRRRGVVPTIDVGLIEQLRAGRVEVVPTVVGFAGGEVELAGGRRLRADAVIAATGYRDGLAELLGLGGPGGVQGSVANVIRGRVPGLHAVGLFNSPQGVLFRINLESRRVARAIARAERGR